MEEDSYRLSGDISLAVPADHADKLISLGNGDSALLYLYALRRNGTFSLGTAARELKRPQADIRRAAELLRQKGLFAQGNTSKIAPLPPPDQSPEYTAEDITCRTQENSEFQAVVSETQRIMGKLLTGADLRTLFGIYDYLGLPAEVILLLVNHCVEETCQRLGPGKLPTMRSIEKEAYVWADRELLTLERAEEHLCRKRERDCAMGEIRHILQIHGRNLTSTERGYVESWIDMGFTSEAIALAYDKTVIKTGSLQWKYMNSILISWHGKGLHTQEEIESGDLRSPSMSAAGKSRVPIASHSAAEDPELLRKILRKSKNS